ncbi:hypothetical protein B9Q04_19745 [Candidatus Marsarchaeota G2 archaeon BE_D]|jgi:Nucleotidyltransferase domain.|uniref:Polymerase nucleotidyl transferase domain-containing protein n=1 Tax=Candidatus Marsarchaeota G2 archaeon BE_D TaxID=1978158 RepID=A0A2R6BZ95_9ARCH|nr:MAG: hypothetical protein B9Q04_19745 [Candidatus Marsarchaeota G2 archaeon BE_D]
MEVVLGAFERRRKYFEDWRRYAEELCVFARRWYSDARIIVFGSVVKGGYDVLSSDIDVLVVTERAPSDVWEIARFRVSVQDYFCEPAIPFELHVVSPEQYEGLYKRLIDKYVEVC